MEGSIRCLVSGHVQGVWFRSATQERARMLGLCGVVRNLPDGRVEVIARGERDALLQLRSWLDRGPPAAHVTGVICDEVVDSGYRDFTTG
jgi:acylphosphatase